MKALVTGGGGFLGLYITEQLVARGDDVRVFCRGEYPRLRELGVDCRRGDIRDRAAVVAACAGIETVFHTVAIPGVWGPWSLYYDTNTLGTENVIAGCRQHSVERFVFTSSPSVVFDRGDHLDADESLPYPARYLCHYPKSKALAEQHVLAANGQKGLASCALRPHLVWGPRDNHLIPRLLSRARRGRLMRIGTGDNLISMTYVENAAAAHLQAADALSPTSPVAGQAYFINEPEPVNLWGWVDELLALADIPPVKRSVSIKTASTIGCVLEAVYRILRLPGEPPMTRFVAAQLNESHCYSIDKARRDFNYKPPVTVEEGMRRLGRELRGELD